MLAVKNVVLCAHVRIVKPTQTPKNLSRVGAQTYLWYDAAEVHLLHTDIDS